jgi:hypothetical protein
VFLVQPHSTLRKRRRAVIAKYSSRLLILTVLIPQPKTGLDRCCPPLVLEVLDAHNVPHQRSKRVVNPDRSIVTASSALTLVTPLPARHLRTTNSITQAKHNVGNTDTNSVFSWVVQVCNRLHLPSLGLSGSSILFVQGYHTTQQYAKLPTSSGAGYQRIVSLRTVSRPPTYAVRVKRVFVSTVTQSDSLP